jgi:hypothetical protein
MDNARGHLAILAGAGVAAVVLSAVMAGGRQSDPDTSTPVVVTLPQRAIEPPAPRPAVRPPVGGDRASLTRALQGELRRVGCYDGEIGGTWDARSRAAMKAFTERVNAALPVDTPDQVLLALVQGHQGRACGPTCPSGQTQAGDGRCTPNAILAKPGKTLEPRQTEAIAKAEPAIVAVPAPVPAVRRTEPPPRELAPSRAQAPPPEPASPAPPKEALASPPPPSGPVPSVGIYERRIKRMVRRAPATARSLLRKLERATTAW